MTANAFGKNLWDLPHLLPTPKARDYKDAAVDSAGNHRPDDMDSVPRAIKHLLPTPTASCNTGAGSSGRDGGLNIQTAVAEVGALIGTPTAGWHGDFGRYTAAVERWEQVFGRAAPSPVVDGGDGRPRLNPAFVEWMMGLPAGWVTDCGVSRTQALQILGNGVVPQQAALALQLLLETSPLPRAQGCAPSALGQI